MRSAKVFVFCLLALAVPLKAAPIDVPQGDLEAFDTAPASLLPPVPASQRLVGVAYTTWHQSTKWTNVWGTPQGGFYKSDDRAVIWRHGEELAAAGVDFLWIDWSNDIGYVYNPATPRPDFDMIEGATFTVFDEFAAMRREGKKTPNISLFLGTPDIVQAAADGRLQRKADQIWNQFVANPLYRPLVQQLDGKPLLVVYAGTPSPVQNGVPQWNDPRFTVRWMTGFITQQHALMTPNLVSKYGYWSWEDRGPQTYAVVNGQPEAMTIVATWRDDAESRTPGRHNGETFRREWERARKIGPKFALVVSWNEWTRGEQPSAEISKDLEPSREFGRFYLDLLGKEIALFKNGK